MFTCYFLQKENETTDSICDSLFASLDDNTHKFGPIPKERISPIGVNSKF